MNAAVRSHSHTHLHNLPIYFVLLRKFESRLAMKVYGQRTNHKNEMMCVFCAQFAVQWCGEQAHARTNEMKNLCRNLHFTTEPVSNHADIGQHERRLFSRRPGRRDCSIGVRSESEKFVVIRILWLFNGILSCHVVCCVWAAAHETIAICFGNNGPMKRVAFFVRIQLFVFCINASLADTHTHTDAA